MRVCAVAQDGVSRARKLLGIGWRRRCDSGKSVDAHEVCSTIIHGAHSHARIVMKVLLVEIQEPNNLIVPLEPAATPRRKLQGHLACAMGRPSLTVISASVGISLNLLT